jgi:MOSC domain-containing protein YiiM
MTQIVSINVGAPSVRVYGEREVLTAGHKRPVPSAMLRRANFDGDRQADLKHHGGPDKAVCVYSFEHYPFWEETLGVPLAPGAFSENLTIASLRESEVRLGDTFRAGQALVQLSQPRQPCSKLAGRHARADLPDLIHRTSFSGFYLRVLEEGMVRSGDAFELVARHPAGVTVAFANQVMYRQRADRESLLRVLNVDALSAAWRKTLSRRL